MSRTVAIVEAEITALRAELAVLKAAAKSVALPEVGTLVSFKTRTGAVVSGAVVLGASPAGGKGKPAMIKVQVGQGFKAEIAVIFPSALV